MLEGTKRFLLGAEYVAWLESEVDRCLRRPSLFQKKVFVSAAGIPMSWKIEADALTDEDWATIADICAPNMDPFFHVVPVPTGGIKLAKAFEKYVTPFSTTILVVDDVWTTGKSMVDVIVKTSPVSAAFKGFVAFARCQLLPTWVDCFMQTRW